MSKEFNITNMNSQTNLNSTFIRDKHGDKVYLFDEIRAFSTQGGVYETTVKGFCIHKGELVVLVWDTQFFTSDHIEKIKK